MKTISLSRETYSAWRFLAPTVICLGIVVVYPFCWAFGLSFFDYFILRGNPQFVGISNFIKLFTDDFSFWTTLKNTIIWVCGIVIAEYIVGFVAASLLNQDLPGRLFFRTLIFIPWVVPPVVASLTWKVIYDPFTGLFNWILRNLGIIETSIAFLSSPSLALLSCMLVRFWRGIPFATVMLLAGLQAINPELYESADVDGATWFQKLIFITLPQMKAISMVVILLRCIWTFNAFDEVYVLTGGGPANATTIASLFTYQTAFSYYKIGYASSIGVVMFLILLFPVMIYIREIKKSWR
jgi:multiple sugar transport system permease protein